MNTTTLSSKGQVIIPKPLREALHWEPGQQLEVIGVDGGGILLKPTLPFAPATLDQVAACLRYSGTTKTLADFEAAIQKGVKERFGDSR
jgi:AbrB family looped-hinge helix DNA binding protein